VLSPIWPAAATLNPGSPAGTTIVLRQLEHLGFFTGLGVVIVFVAALALGRMTVIGVREARMAEGRAEPVTEPEPVTAGRAPTATTADVPSTSATSTGRPAGGSLHTFSRWLVARRS
jgi:hypothetical protein